MNAKFKLVLITSAFFQLGILHAQNNMHDLNKSDIDTPEANIKRVVVNIEMIERFNQCETDGKLVSWSDLVLGFDYQSLSDLFYAYRTADLDNQTLEEIRLALEDRQTEHLNNSNITDNDLAWFNQVKQEINSKLGMKGMVVQR
ncbi:MAG: hypothetical protein JW723_02960 [Bacteroidales bacterium]|nr:hypothetical protein [Bacteroidales bacterium]